jgi:hypothetical protein
MTPDEGKRTALGYAWGREDASDIKTAGDGPAQIGHLTFADAYAQGQDDYNSERRGGMIGIREAYANWQASGGRSIFARGDLTLGDDERAELGQMWHAWVASDEARSAYYARQAEMQAAAWDALTAATDNQ